MSNFQIPTGHHVVMPYLIIPNASQFLTFAKEVFHAEEIFKSLREGSDEIMHAEIKIGDSVIMLGNSSDQWKPRRASLYIYVNNGDETYEKALSKGATSVIPMEDKPYGRSGGVEDPFGNVWWITSIQ